MSKDDVPFSISQQKALISAELHPTLLAQFLFGIYTGLFPVTLYIYTHKENRTKSRDRIIIGSITALYISTVLFLVSNWLFTNILFSQTGPTRVDMFWESISGNMPLGERMVGTVATFVVYLFADGLLVWRCFHACGRSFGRSFLPMALLTVEIALVISSTVYSCLFSAKPDFETIQTAQISDKLAAASLTSAAATSFVSTFLICQQIWRHTAPRARSRKHYRNIINTLIQSSALYTITILILAVLAFTNTGDIASSFTILLVAVWITAPSQIISGLAPTLMIIALVVSSSQKSNEVSDFTSYASYANGVNSESPGANHEMQQSGSPSAEEQENEEIQVIPGSDHEIADVGEARLKTLA
ncbi:hypothetical protein D9613_010201 [Agrocybe pediades]|uniref:Uncharacterized protein n=1 Tax=Agrocybe pediades TaxID=84607 RepID=A0A8H4QFX0_9AGAR|nr:hypothetical protein D9613_010201 [Agrocybe pediades]